MPESILQIVREDPATTLASTFLGTGEVLAGQGYHLEALAYLQKAIALRPNFDQAIDVLAITCYNRAATLLDEGRMVEAECFLRKALSSRSNFPPATERLAETLVRRAKEFLAGSQPARAESASREALALHPDFAEAMSALDAALVAQATSAATLDGEEERLTAAETELRRTLAINLGSPQVVRYLALNLYQQAGPRISDGRLAEAENSLRSALALWPEFFQATDTLAFVLYQSAVPCFNAKRFAEVETALWEALSIKPDFTDAAKLLDICARHPARTIVNVTEPRYTARALELNNALRPKDVMGQSYVRMGRDGDGGYVMVDRGLDNAVVYSLGVGDDVSWDQAMANAGCHIYQYDHTVDRLPTEHPNFHWSKIGIAAEPGSNGPFRTLDELIGLNGHEGRNDLVLKVDIEGAEWPMFAHMQDTTLRQFSQIVGEFHNLPRILDLKYSETVSRALAKINEHFQLVHIHANNYGSLTVIGGVIVYNDLELTFVRKGDHKFVENKRTFPTPLDRPCNTKLADYFIC